MIVADFTKSVTTLEEMSEVQSKYDYIEANLENIVIDENWQVVLGEKKYNLTQQALEAISKLLGIPYKYAIAIPTDLFQDNMDRLKNIKKGLVSICLRDDNVIVNFYKYRLNKKTDMPLPCTPLDTSNLMEYFADGKYRTEKCLIGDFGAIIDVVDTSLGQVNLVEEGDVIDVGYRIVNPFTQVSEGLEMSLMLSHDGFCMRLPSALGKAKVSLTKELGDQDRYFAKLMESHANWMGSKFVFADIKKLVMNTRGLAIKYRFFVPMLGKVHKMSEFMSSQVFGVMEWKDDNKYYREELEDDEAGDSKFEYWKSIFDIGQEVRKMEGLERLDFENYMSVVLQMAEKQLKLYPKVEEGN